VLVGEHDRGDGSLKPRGIAYGAHRFPPIVRPFCRRPICCHLAIRAYYYRTILSRARIVDRRRHRGCQNDHCAVIWIVPDGGLDGTQLSSCSFDQPASSMAMIEFFLSGTWRRFADVHGKWRSLVSSGGKVATPLPVYVAHPSSSCLAGQISKMCQSLMASLCKYQNQELSFESVIVSMALYFERRQIVQTSIFLCLF